MNGGLPRKTETEMNTTDKIFIAGHRSLVSCALVKNLQQ
ncbi:MAG: hypothetical protein QG660_1940 [Pseudomonadota bacterium]|nr:hypothetical protein [Pseudomonadota bacterium]